MAQLRDNKDVASYFVTKHSWRGKYKRVFSVGTSGIVTYNLNTLEVTNQWSYDEFIGIAPNAKSQTTDEFLITFLKPTKKSDVMRFSTEHRADLLTEALKFRHKFADKQLPVRRFNSYKYHWSEKRLPIILEVGPSSVDQIDTATNKVICSYEYREMEGFTTVTDCPGGFALVCGGYGRMHLFASEYRDEILKLIPEFAANHVGVCIRRKESITLDHYWNRLFGSFSNDESITSYAEFTVQKVSHRHLDPVRRTLCLTENCLIERDPASYSIISCKPLSDIFAIIRDQHNPQQFSVEFLKGYVRTFLSTDRDALIASLLDGVRASGNRDIHVKMTFTKRGLRFGPYSNPVDEEVESQHMKFVQSPPANMTFSETVLRFNCNVSYSGLLHAVTADTLFAENKEKLIKGTLLALLDKENDTETASVEELEAQFQALRRLAASKAGFMSFTQLPKMREKIGLKVVKSLKRNSDGVTHAALDMVCALMQPMHDDYDLRQEQLNKASIMSSESFLQSLLDMFKTHVVRGSGALVIAAMLDFMTFALCAPYSETTDGSCFDKFLTMVANDGRSIFKLFQHPSMAIVKGAGLVMKAVIEEGEADIAARMQDLALAEGALPRHLHTAMFTASTDNRMLTLRQLGRHLVGLWVTGHPTAMALLRRILPIGLLSYLDSKDDPPDVDVDRLHIRDNLKLAQEDENRRQGNIKWKVIEKRLEAALEHWRSRMGFENKQLQDQQKPIVLRKRRQRIKSEANWKLFYYQFEQNHTKPNLIWNFKTREELRNALEEEIRAFNLGRDLSNSCIISWNHNEFEVQYHSLDEEIKIGDYYLRLLLEEDENEEASAIKKSAEFFNDLYHRFLLTPKTNMKCMCLQAMAIVYGRCHEEIGGFNDTRFIVSMLDRCTDRAERDRLLLFIHKLVSHKKNVKEIMDANGVRLLVDLLTLAHLHVTRATVPMQSNVLEAAPDMKRDAEKEWYYGNAEKERLGPFGFDEMKQLWEEKVLTPKTRCWSPGMDGWRPLVNVPQLKWCLLASGQSVLNETDLATLILNILIRMCEYYPSRDADDAIVRPLPRIKQFLSEATCLPHIVQLLLTFDPVLVEKVATLLYLVFQDNPSLSRLYLSGVFFFILMYTGSNVLPIARFLKYTHLKQAFLSEENKSSDIVKRSVLGHLLPEAMICYLENYESEKFAETFLGEFDTPEAIWSSEMRRLMIEKIAAHLSDYTPRLQSNTRALYQYCPIPIITFPQLENELFCSIYYLRHLCDIQRFPNWPIKEPVKLLKEILEAWKAEVDKKPPSMSLDDAYEVLELPKGEGGHDESKVRKAYFRLAQKYHPDKNPDGREIFEKVNKAYEYLCSKSKLTEGPDPKNIVLILKAQSILFSRYSEVLSEYKYAGYPALVKTIRMETHDDALFSKSAPLLAAASELCYHTVKCSALNAEELRRENGIEVLQEAFNRCVSILSRSTKPEDLAVQVCDHIAHCYAVASQFGNCREKIQEIPAIVKDLCRILYYKHLTRLCATVTETMAAFSVDAVLQLNLHQNGALWSLLLFLFNYDYTLEEGGVEKSGESNQQEVSNLLAKLAVTTCARLAGYLSGELASPDNYNVKRSLCSLLTPYIANKLKENNPPEVLKLLNSNTENPCLVWNNATRAELTEFLSENEMQKIRTGECDPSFGAEFVFTSHRKELIIGDVFIRVYNEQPTFPLENPKGFTIDLLDYLGSQAQYFHSLMALQLKEGETFNNVEKVKHVEMALEALRNALRNNPGVEIQCIGHFKLLFSLLRVESCPSVQQRALEAVQSVTANQECIADIAASEVMGYLLMLIPSLPNCQLLVLETLYPLSSNTKLLKEIMNKGALIYMLDLYCNSLNPTLRQQTAELFAKILADKLVGPKVRLILCKFLPPVFMDAMRDSAEASVHMFEGTHENPELIWNDEARESVQETVKRMKDQHYQAQRANLDARWNITDDFTVVYANVQGELVVGGVFLRLFIANPAWMVRRPKEFLSELLEKWSQLVTSNHPVEELLETVTTAIVALFSTQPNMLEQVPQLGYVPRFFRVMSTQNSTAPKSAVRIVHQLSNSNVCVQSMSQVESIGPIKSAMQSRTDVIGLACEAMMKMFETGSEELVEQALKTEMVQYLVKLLETRMEQQENPSAVKAQIVNALKAMLRSLKYGDQVSNILSQFPIWKDYKDQKHDLFLVDRPTVGYLQGPGVAGYLTSGQSNSMPTAPPPMQ